MGANIKLMGAALLVLANNIAWYYATDDKQPAAVQTVTAPTKSTAQATTQEPINTPSLTIKNAPIAQHTHIAPAAPKTMELEANLPARESEQLIADQAFSKETFTFDSPEQKIATIQQLAPQGEDLIFLQKIIESNDSDEVKIAALERLNGQQHFGALNTALTVLNKNNTNLSMAALGIIKNSRDTSLIPQLRSLALNAKNEMLQQEINATIGHLENSLTMGMDFANR
ncbi:MAG TPA: hypothetical protein PKD17_03925 [Cellvibrionaceae bacterium]|nr:hypothetical protein [Cellvibrionaceae bacterium]HMW70939.1 hypothetical protein [Cellvibrionaceae bacterium]HMY41286.1 hypothetical protein [Marinagarivorans sp.]HNG58301.1 hypothetical protein [Cellvibrionaceae bacterium]